MSVNGNTVGRIDATPCHDAGSNPAWVDCPACALRSPVPCMLCGGKLRHFKIERTRYIAFCLRLPLKRLCTCCQHLNQIIDYDDTDIKAAYQSIRKTRLRE